MGEAESVGQQLAILHEVVTGVKTESPETKFSFFIDESEVPKLVIDGVLPASIADTAKVIFSKRKENYRFEKYLGKLTKFEGSTKLQSELRTKIESLLNFLRIKAGTTLSKEGLNKCMASLTTGLAMSFLLLPHDTLIIEEILAD